MADYTLKNGHGTAVRESGELFEGYVDIDPSLLNSAASISVTDLLIVQHSTDTPVKATLSALLTVALQNIALGSDATGDLYFRNTSGHLGRIPIGDTAGKVLAVNEAKNGYEFIDPPTGSGYGCSVDPEDLILSDNGKAVIASVSSPDENPGSGISLWPLNNVLTDSWGGYTLTNAGVTFVVDADRNNDYVASMGYSYLSFNAASLPTGASPWTVTGWMKTSTGGLTIIYWGEGDYSNNSVWIDVLSGKLRVEAGTTYNSNINVTDSVWHFIAVTYDGTTLRTYVDAVAGGSYSVTFTVASSSTGYIGGNASGGKGPGYLSAIRVYSAALSAEDLLGIYNSTVTRSYQLSSKPVALADTVASSETTVTSSYTANYNTATVHRIATTASTACALAVSNIPVGKALVIRVDNANAGSVTFNSTEIISSTATGITFLTFVNVTGTIEQVS